MRRVYSVSLFPSPRGKGSGAAEGTGVRPPPGVHLTWSPSARIFPLDYRRHMTLFETSGFRGSARRIRDFSRYCHGETRSLMKFCSLSSNFKSDKKKEKVDHFIGTF